MRLEELAAVEHRGDKRGELASRRSFVDLRTLIAHNVTIKLVVELNIIHYQVNTGHEVPRQSFRIELADS